jgi:hypothetical protein
MTTETADAVRRELFRLADAEEQRAAEEAATVPYWAPYPDSVAAHRAAARVLRQDAERLQRDLGNMWTVDG